MTNTGKQIADLLMDTGESAPDMTHAVKVLGNGSMQKGFSRIGEYFAEEASSAAAKGLTKGRIQGGVAGALGAAAAIVGVLYLISKKKEKAAKHEVEGQIILQTMKESSVNADGEELDENTVVDTDNTAKGSEPSEE